MNDTKTRILDAAEKLFAEAGFASTSLRRITAEARVNLAAVNYHFQSKDALVQAVFTRRLGPVNRRRLEMLDAFQARAGGAAPLEEIIEAFAAPVLGADSNGGEASFGRLLGRMYTEPTAFARNVLAVQMSEIAQRFVPALARALPELPPVELYTRIQFMIGALAISTVGLPVVEIASGGVHRSGGAADTLRRMVVFLAAGLRAAAPREA